MKRKILTLSTMFVFIYSINIVRADFLPDLFLGGSYQFDSFILSNWELVNAENVNVDNIDISTGYGPNEFGVWSKNHELFVDQGEYGDPETLTLAFDFKVKGVGVNITQVAGDLGYKRVSGYTYDSPYVTGSIAVGTSKGNSDLGTSTDIFSLTQDPGTIWIDIPGGLNEIWVRNTLYLNSSHYGYAEAGYLDPYGEGPAFRNRFSTEMVPVPATAWLFITGLLGLAGYRRKRRL